MAYSNKHGHPLPLCILKIIPTTNVLKFEESMIFYSILFYSPIFVEDVYVYECGISGVYIGIPICVYSRPKSYNYTRARYTGII